MVSQGYTNNSNITFNYAEKLHYSFGDFYIKLLV